MKPKYEEEVQSLVKAMDIAIEVLQKYPPEGWSTNDIEFTVKIYNEDKHMALEDKIKSISSLRQFENECLAFFQESGGEAVEQFWKAVKEEDLPYVRENQLEKILKKKKISNDAEFNYVIDTLVPMQQNGMINREQALALSNYLGDYENRQSGKGNH